MTCFDIMITILLKPHKDTLELNNNNICCMQTNFTVRIAVVALSTITNDRHHLLYLSYIIMVLHGFNGLVAMRSRCVAKYQLLIYTNSLEHCQSNTITSQLM